MSGIGGSRRGASKNRPSNVIYEEIVPDFEWIEDPTNHWLGLEVPGFRREEVKLEVNTYGLIKIGGERKMSEIKYIWFEQTFQAPQNSKPEDCRVGLEEGIFYVQIPKKATHTVHASKEDADHQKGKKVNDTTEKIPPNSTPTKPPRDDAGSDVEKGKKVNDSGGGTTENIPASTPTKPPKDDEGSDVEKGKKVNDSGGGTTEYIPANSTPNKPPRDDEGSDLEKGKKVNDSGGGTTEQIPASTPTKPPKDDEGSDLEKGKKVNDSGEFPNENEGKIENIPAATPPLETTKDEEEDSIQEKGKKGNGNGAIIPNDSKGTSKEKEYDDAKGEEKSNFLAKVGKRVKQNMGILITVILIFSAGVLVSQDKRKKANSNDQILLAKLDSQNHNHDDE
nr:inactive protein RESTRICTED TEV MOVEMENT 2-like [Ipomoea batatas]